MASESFLPRHDPVCHPSLKLYIGTQPTTQTNTPEFCSLWWALSPGSPPATYNSFDIFFSGHPTIFPALFISSMDYLQRPISSLTQLLSEFASNSATSALPLLSSADFQPALRPSH
ncbi:hypothetical protein CRENBAI_002639 [Crenichthys baileyi]|uniref:Uncharacterized protein n=1 Tax=Crenichthys baileyi TaxID=28760 RepID=A0AAV9QWW0_9TELE